MIAVVVCQPVAVSNGNNEAAVEKFMDPESETVDMEASEVLLKIVEKKIAKLIIKCHKLGGCKKHVSKSITLES